MTYDPIPYWQERGHTYRADFRPDRYRRQETELARVLKGLQFDSVLDVGCGFGRIYGLLPKRVRYVGIDVSGAMLATHIGRGLPWVSLVETALRDYRASGKFDLVIAVEMLMHVPPGDVQAAVRKLDRLSARAIVTCDWTTPVPRPAPHNFLHDYSGMGGRKIPVGLQTIRVIEK
jgi:SAM-dependent methyltransferase